MKNLVLDIGNVICEWNPKGIIGAQFPDPGDYERVFNATIADADWQELDRGSVSLEIAISNAQQRYGTSPEKIAQVYLTTPASLKLLPGIENAIRYAKSAGKKLYVLSNMPHHSWDYLCETYDFWGEFDGKVISCEVGFIKPETEIYQYLLNTWDLVADETLFIDDMPYNIEAARSVGINGVVMETPHRCAEIIRSLVDESL